jgi:hypothetical protein
MAQIFTINANGLRVSPWNDVFCKPWNIVPTAFPNSRTQVLSAPIRAAS